MDKYVLPINSISNLNDNKKSNKETEDKEEILKNNNFDSYLETSLKKIDEENKKIRQKQNEGTKQFLENVKQQIQLKNNEIAKTK